MKKLSNDMKDFISRVMRESSQYSFYYKNSNEGLRVYSHHMFIWGIIDRAEQIFGWGSIHSNGDPVRRIDDKLSYFVIRGLQI